MINNSFITYCLSEYPNLKLKLKSKIQIKQQKYYIQKKTETFLKHLLLENRLKKKFLIQFVYYIILIHTGVFGIKEAYPYEDNEHILTLQLKKKWQKTV